MDSPAWRLDHYRAVLDLHSWRFSLDVARPGQGLALHDLRRQADALSGQTVNVPARAAAGLRILGVELSDCAAGDVPIAECYVRGLDLVATYMIPALATRVQVYWRAASDAPDSQELDSHTLDGGAAATAIDLQVSVQTDVLDARPRVSTRSVLAGDRVERLIDARSPSLARVAIDAAAPVLLAPDASPACLLFSLGGGLAYVEMVHPADFRQCRLSRRGEELVIEHDLFAEKDLEKGVILRARVRGLLLRSAATDRAGGGPAAAVEVIAAEAYERFVAAAPPLTT
jgi:hypothetical protein